MFPIKNYKYAHGVNDTGRWPIYKYSFITNKTFFEKKYFTYVLDINDIDIAPFA